MFNNIFTRMIHFVKHLYFPAIVFSNISCMSAYEYDLAICAIFQNEAPYLKEWIDFHKKQGVEHFWLYNNLSQDNYLEVLQSYISEGLVDLIDWPYPNNDNSSIWHWIQCNAYNDGISRMQGKVKWCAFIDSDEFLFSPIGKLFEKIDQYDRFSGIAVNWICYGTSNVKKIPIGESIRKHLVMRAENDFFLHHTIKTIAKIDKISHCNHMHFMTYTSGYAVNENFNKVNEHYSEDNTRNILRINHYIYRDEDYLYNIKIPRLKRYNMSLESILEGVRITNLVYDPIISD